METEEGVIAFIRGQMIGLEAGQHQGEEALNVMSQWRNCYFSFMSPDQSGNAPLLLGGPDMLSTTSAPPSAPPLRNPPVPSPIPREPSPNDQTQGFVPSTLPLQAIPMQVTPFETALPVLDRMGSRIYCQVYLLADGRRSIAELMRLTGHSPTEMDKILHDLVQAGLIRVQ